MDSERTNLCKMLDFGAIPITILFSGVPKHSCSHGPKILAKGLFQLHGPNAKQSSRSETVRKVVNEGTWCHAFESERKRAFRKVRFDSIGRMNESSAPRGAVVIHICYRDASHAEAIYGTLRAETRAHRLLRVGR